MYLHIDGDIHTFYSNVYKIKHLPEFPSPDSTQHTHREITMFTRGRCVVVFPRVSASRAMIGLPSRMADPIVITYDLLLSKRSLPLFDVASALGISVSSLKKVARRLGIKNWSDFRRDSHVDSPEYGPCDPMVCVCGHHYMSLDFNRFDFPDRIREISDLFSTVFISKAS